MFIRNVYTYSATHWRTTATQVNGFEESKCQENIDLLFLTLSLHFQEDFCFRHSRIEAKEKNMLRISGSSLIENRDIADPKLFLFLLQSVKRILYQIYLNNNYAFCEKISTCPRSLLPPA